MKKIYGFGINDLKGSSTSKFYKIWDDMLRRCYSSPFQEKHPTYIGCSVCEDWLTFSKFKAWMVTQDWEGKCLDKDLLVPGNKVYSPETCVFIEQGLNNFLLERNALKGLYPIGVSLDKVSKKFKSRCRCDGKQIYLGLFDTPEQAHEAWREKKKELAKNMGQLN